MHLLMAVESKAGEMDKIRKYLDCRRFPRVCGKGYTKVMAREIRLYDLSFPESEKESIIKHLQLWEKNGKRGPKGSTRFDKIYRFGLRIAKLIGINLRPVTRYDISDLSKTCKNIDELHPYDIHYAYNVMLGESDDEYSIRGTKKGVELT